MYKTYPLTGKQSASKQHCVCVLSCHCKVNTYNTMEVHSRTSFKTSISLHYQTDSLSLILSEVTFDCVWTSVVILISSLCCCSLDVQMGAMWTELNCIQLFSPQLLACYSNPGPQPRPLTRFLHTLQWPLAFNTTHHMQLDKTNQFSKHLV